MNINTLINGFKAIKDRNASMRQPDKQAQLDAAARIGEKVAELMAAQRLIDQKVKLTYELKAIKINVIAESDSAFRIEFEGQSLHHLLVDLFDDQVQVRAYHVIDGPESTGEQLYRGTVN